MIIQIMQISIKHPQGPHLHVVPKKSEDKDRYFCVRCLYPLHMDYLRRGSCCGITYLFKASISWKKKSWVAVTNDKTAITEVHIGPEYKAGRWELLNLKCLYCSNVMIVHRVHEQCFVCKRVFHMSGALEKFDIEETPLGTIGDTNDSQ